MHNFIDFRIDLNRNAVSPIFMKKFAIIFSLLTIFILSLNFLPAYSSNTVEYTVTIHNDGSASWIIVQVIDINAPSDDWWTFKNKVMSLVNEAQNITGRKMTADGWTITQLFSPETSIKKVRYEFSWSGFANYSDSQIVVGDVFQVSGFFDKLYGDGALYMIYPSERSVKEALPKPDGTYASIQMLKWISAKDFCAHAPKIVLISSLPQQQVSYTSQLMILTLIVVAVPSTLFIFLKVRKRGQRVIRQPVYGVLEGDEEKILKLIEASGGRIYQSIIVKECGFSKAKTSQILTTLEKKGVLRRVRKGRSKIVILEGG
jgi:uncharacterized membrane protein